MAPAAVVVDGGGGVARRTRGPVHTRWATQLGLRWSVAVRPLQQCRRRQLSRKPGCSSGFRLHGVAPVIEEEEVELLVHVVGHEGARKLGNGGDGELGPPAMADACPATERSEVERGGAREGVGK